MDKNLFFILLGGILLMGANKYFTARGIRNNNPGNLKISSNAWKGKKSVLENTDGVFEQFTTPEYGIRALYIDLRSKINRGVNTIDKILNIYAPDNENNTIAYINSVESISGINRNKTLSINDIPSIIPAIIKVENGTQPYTDSLLKLAYSMV